MGNCTKREKQCCSNFIQLLKINERKCFCERNLRERIVVLGLAVSADRDKTCFISFSSFIENINSLKWEDNCLAAG